jgi:UDP-N-acetylmuramoyl-L-alanyl-D-glutamate--2,6-diaminopimelate ligase
MLGLRPYAPRVRPLSDIAAVAGVTDVSEQVLEQWRSVRVSGVTHDSRQVRPGDLYVALPGSNAHGASFAPAAGGAGAVAVLTDPLGTQRASLAGLPVLVVRDPRAVLGAVAADVYGHPARDLLMLGVTGTNGKTTMAYLLEAGLRAAGHRTGLVGTVEVRLADEAIASVRTTPEATDLQALFAVMREREVSAVAMEVSSHALALGRVDGMTFDVATFTNLSQDHLDFHFSLESYYQAKAGLFIPERTELAVVNVDDEYGRRLAGEADARGLSVTTYSAAGSIDAHWRAEDVELEPFGSSFRVTGPSGVRADVSVRLPGLFNVENALGAVVTLVTAGITLEEAALGVSECAGVPGRMERVEAGQPYLALVDYAHTPDAVETLLQSLRDVTKGRIYVVLGCGGDRDRSKRPLMGAAAARLSDVAVFTNDNPRSEDPGVILAAMKSGADRVPARERGKIVIEPDRAAAIRLAVRQAAPGDTVVVAGKGHEQGQEVKGELRPFDDRVQLEQAIEEARR